MKTVPARMANWARSRVSLFECDCTEMDKNQWVDYGETKTCPYCGTELDGKMVHEKIKVKENQ